MIRVVQFINKTLRFLKQKIPIPQSEYFELVGMYNGTYAYKWIDKFHENGIW